MQVAIRYGLILGVVNILLAVFGYIMGVEFTMSYYAIISGIVSIAAIGASYNYIFNNFIAPEYAQEIAKVSLDKAEGLMESMGMQESDIDKAMEEARKSSNESLENPLFPFIQGIMVGAVVLFVIALLAAIFVQRKPVEGEFLYDDEILDDSDSNKESW